MRSRVKNLVYLLVAGWLLLGSSVRARAQTVDPAFRPGEVYRSGSVKALAAYPDGRVLALGGFSFVDGLRAGPLVRFGADGSFDPGYHPDMAPNMANLIGNMQTLANGKLLLVGYNVLTVGTHSAKTLLVLHPDGRPDTTFRYDHFTYAAYGRRGVTCTLVQPDGKILVGNDSFTRNGISRSGLVRLNADGTYDASFAPAGLALGDVRALALTPDGKIMVGGDFTYSTATGTTGRRLLRLNADGSPDPSFLCTAYLTIDELRVQPDGKILVAGSGGNSFGNGAASFLHRLRPDGTPDPDFTPPVGTSMSALSTVGSSAMVLQADGRILVGAAPYATNEPPRLLRFRPNGQPDPDWHLTGGPDDIISTLVQRADGTLLVGGGFTQWGRRLGCLAAFTAAAGDPSPTFSPKLYHLGSVQALARQPDGKLLLVGDFTEVNGTAYDKVARLQASGEADTTFHSPAGIRGELLTVVPQADGRILIGGNLQEVAGQQRLGVARLLANGQLDASFQVTGLYYNGPATQQRVRCIVPQADGKMLLGGSLFHVGTGTYHFNLLRVLADGSLDASFNPPLSGGGEVAVVQPLPDGKLLLGGVWFNPRAEVLTRLLASGQPDPTFTPLVPDPTPGGFIRTIALLPDRRIMAAGRLLVAFQRATYHMVLLQPDGSRDASFNSILHQDSNVEQLVRQPNGRYLIAGQLGAASAPSYLLRVTDSGATDFTFNVGRAPDGPVRAMLLEPNAALVLGGEFQAVAGVDLFGLARLMVPQVLQVAAPGAPVLSVRAYPNPVRDQLRVALEPGARQLALLDLTGRVQWVRARPGRDVVVPVQQLPAGIYVVRADYVTGPATYRVVVQ